MFRVLGTQYLTSCDCVCVCVCARARACLLALEHACVHVCCIFNANMINGSQEAANTRKKEMQNWEIHRIKQEKPSDLEEVCNVCAQCTCTH